ncbi:hypothetical protein [Streptomyces sp. NPDC005262]
MTPTVATRAIATEQHRPVRTRPRRRDRDPVSRALFAPRRLLQPLEAAPV